MDREDPLADADDGVDAAQRSASDEMIEPGEPDREPEPGATAPARPDLIVREVKRHALLDVLAGGAIEGLPRLEDRAVTERADEADVTDGRQDGTSERARGEPGSDEGALALGVDHAGVAAVRDPGDAESEVDVPQRIAMNQPRDALLPLRELPREWNAHDVHTRGALASRRPIVGRHDDDRLAPAR